MQQLLLVSILVGLSAEAQALKPVTISNDLKNLNMSLSLEKVFKQTPVIPAKTFGCNGIDLEKALMDVYGNYVGMMGMMSYVCESTPHESPDRANMLHWHGSTKVFSPPNIQFMVQDCQRFLFGHTTPANMPCKDVGTVCPSCAAPAGVIATINIKREKVPGNPQAIQCRYVSDCAPFWK
eukprot:TRINITY_DN63677_c0_g1_i1.p1 TRINITY_DN63677_c0_g1~~TRINITY_DN63677_c0_g1_i1.p1  ORF type:complete len:180 (-),score=13.20 TRINITY_DN63677_c0_g1_i1:167-706(-)